MLANILQATGVAVIALGLGFIYPPVGVIVLGVGFLLYGVAVERGK